MTNTNKLGARFKTCAPARAHRDRAPAKWKRTTAAPAIVAPTRDRQRGGDRCSSASATAGRTGQNGHGLGRRRRRREGGAAEARAVALSATVAEEDGDHECCMALRCLGAPLDFWTMGSR
ncbi:unnamed protein product [Prorocentrum cordatum]|uniref:Uncharacterized protein n=1 Tax=Prorocentrum cordatum TaxID=2364126 RepID=A0ABN9UK84_9DINO|nr:unnamed protein product [Polarella glacialis]